MRMRILVSSLPFLLLVAACGSDGGSPAPTPTIAKPTATSAPVTDSFSAVLLLKGFARPTFVTNAGDGSNRLFVVEKPGRIRVVKAGLLLAQPFLDISTVVKSTSNEQGLLGLAFHPDFEKNGRFFVAYTAQNADNTVAEYRVATPGADVAEPTGQVLLAVPDQFPNHNGGMLAFGPDGYLYISMGDGGSSGDPNGNGQNVNSLLGKLLRVDVNKGSPYGIPPTNPFSSRADVRKEIWAYGLRNPWRFTFDRQTGDLWIGDVGQNTYEEVDFQRADSKGGENYGWNTMEGNHCFKPETGCSEAGLVKPIFEYDHGQGCSVTGGYVYRGKAIPALAGRYLFADYCQTTLWATTKGSDGAFVTDKIGKVPKGVSAFGEDEAGEIYLAIDSEGAIYKITPK